MWANNITDISPLSNLTQLSELNLGRNNITDISPLSNLTNLSELDLWDSNITDISPLSNLTNLRWLELSNNNVSDISPLGSLTKLSELYLQSNNITDVSPLGGLTNLRWLSLDANNVSDISPLRGLTNLSWLDLSFNNVSDISSLGGLTNLTELLLRGNPLSSSSINDYIPSFKRSGVTVYFDSFRVGSDFDIELVFLDDDFTQVEKRIIQYAARRWMSIIRDDLPDYTFTQGWSRVCDDHSAIPSGERIDDLRIYVTSFYAFSPLGFASTSLLRDTSLLPVSGCMSLNLQPRRSYYSTPVWRYYYYDSSADLLVTALHEIGHVLGIGIVWEDLGFVQDPKGDAHFNVRGRLPHLTTRADRTTSGRRYRWRRTCRTGGCCQSITSIPC